MFKFAALLFPIIATTLMGMAVVVVLALDMQSGAMPITWAALAGLIASVPVSWLVARQLPGVLRG